MNKPKPQSVQPPIGVSPETVKVIAALEAGQRARVQPMPRPAKARR